LYSVLFESIYFLVQESIDSSLTRLCICQRVHEAIWWRCQYYCGK